MRMKKIIAACALFGAMFAGSTADAQWWGYREYRPTYSGYWYQAPSYWYQQPYYRQWHDTSHWDYHQPQVVPHGNHYHVQPGHYDYHQDGHWH
jgi:hypothetical protein